MAKAKTSFHQHLILNQWVISLFGGKDNFADLLLSLKNEQLPEGINENGQSYFFEALNMPYKRSHFEENLQNDLARYDANIVRHWQKITEKRNAVEGHTLQMKYFQYLSLLFSEIYLDWYFNRQADLITELNATLLAYQQELGKEAKDFQLYTAKDLNKIAFWNATGSGKTLLMHVNILQYRHYFKSEQHSQPEQIILLTPNESLSLQHTQDLKLSDFQVALFDKNQISRNHAMNFDLITVIDINKLGEKDGDKTVAVDSFAGNNLVLVDEGHRGSSGDIWLARREALISNGFSFEYSATIGQAVSNGKTIAQAIGKKQRWQDLSFEQQKNSIRKATFELYAKAVLFDYSYKFFYQDGYGKDCLILNLKEDKFEENRPLYLTACLLVFYQQLYLFQKNHAALTEWNIEKPLWVFVGNKVANEDSDVLSVVQFLAFFLQNQPLVSSWLEDLIGDQARLLNSKGEDIFYRRFQPLAEFKGKIHELYQDILARLFNAPSAGRLHLTLLKKAEGELILSVGENSTAFGIINIGDSNGLFKTAQTFSEFDCSTDDFSSAKFATLNDTNCPLNILIGSRKFSEGWSSWRVSTMGLLNLGRSEGAQIIQLFGRGVRLKGKHFSLKRSNRSMRAPARLHLPVLETLNIFGIRANYMEQFREYLAEEGVDNLETLTIDFKVQPKLPVGVKLKTLRLKDEYKDNRLKGFKRQENLALYQIPEKYQGRIKPIKVVADFYPRLESVASQGATGIKSQYEARHLGQLNSQAFSFFDWDKIYLALQQFKQERSWFNLQVSKQGLQNFVQENKEWYEIYAPQNELEIQRFADIEKQQHWLIELLCRYTEQFYRRLKAAYESDYYETVEVDEQNGSMQVDYQFEIKQPDINSTYIERLETLKKLIENDQFQQALSWNIKNDPVEAICFEPHLFYPIITLKNKDDLPITMQPLLMQQESEQQFTRDLQTASQLNKLSLWTGGRDLYLLRNAANKSKGLGFALAGNFYPDFLLWLVDKNSGKQWLSFVDPKGIRQMNLDDPKFDLAKEVKKLQEKLSGEIELNSFILSVTPFENLINVHLVDNPKQALMDKNILFMDSQLHYLETMFAKILGDEK